MVLRFLQGRNPKWVQRPFLAKYDEKAIWIDDLKPFSGKKFFYTDEMQRILRKRSNMSKIVMEKKLNVSQVTKNHEIKFKERLEEQHIINKKS
jgi:hypothetical protein